MSDRAFGIETLCLHAGQIPDPVTGSRAAPIYQTTSYVFDTADHAASLFNLQTFGNVYSRISNPTVAVLEERIAALENGRAALATASGMSAQMTAILAIVQPGEHIVASSLLYGGTYSQFAVTFARFGIECSFVEPDDPESFRRALNASSMARQSWCCCCRWHFGPTGRSLPGSGTTCRPSAKPTPPGPPPSRCSASSRDLPSGR